MAEQQEGNGEQWRREKVDIICSALQWLNREDVEEYVKDCKDENEVETLFSMLSEGLSNIEKQPNQAHNDDCDVSSPLPEEGATAVKTENVEEFVNVITGEEIGVVELQLIEMFPEVDPEYIKKRCTETQGDSDFLAALIRSSLISRTEAAWRLSSRYSGGSPWTKIRIRGPTSVRSAAQTT